MILLKVLIFCCNEIIIFIVEVVFIPKIISNIEEKRNINFQVRLNKLEKEKLDYVCNALNLSYTDFLLISLDNLSAYLEKGFKNGKFEEKK